MSIKIVKDGAKEKLEELTAFNLDEYLAGKSKVWTFWNSPIAEFPWKYEKVEYAYILEGTFSVEYEGEKPVEITAGDYVRFSPGSTKFNVTKPVRKFFTLVDE